MEPFYRVRQLPLKRGTLRWRLNKQLRRQLPNPPSLPPPLPLRLLWLLPPLLLPLPALAGLAGLVLAGLVLAVSVVRALLAHLQPRGLLKSSSSNVSRGLRLSVAAING